MKKTFLFAIFGIALVFAAGNETLFAQRGSTQAGSVEVKLASPLPKESPWGRTLDRIASEWNRLTSGQVRLNVRHGGIEGSESKMFQSLSSNTIQAAVFTSFGLSMIDPSVMTISAPFLIRNDRELSAVISELQTELDNRMNSGNFSILAWSKTGFVNIFSRDPVFTPDDLRRQRLASGSESAEITTVFKTMGFQIVEANMNDLGTKLAAGAISAAYMNPAATAAYQLHIMMKNMMSTPVAPVMGGIVINQVTWRRIGELNSRYQQQLLNVTRSLAAELDTSLLKTVNDAIVQMERVGLKVNQLTPAQEQLWYNELQRVTPSLLGTVFDRDMYQRIETIVTRIRGGR